MKTEVVTVTVAQRHIKAGKRGECPNCPIALAIKELGYSKVWVSVPYASVDNVSVVLPREALSFIADFDEGEHVDPFWFQAMLPKRTLWHRVKRLLKK